MLDPSRLFALVFALVTFVGHGALFAQADPEPLYYIYHGQPKALELDTERIAVRVTSSPSIPRSSAALPNSLASRGFNQSDVVASPVAGWMILNARNVLPTSRATSSTSAAAGPSQTDASSVHNLLTSLLNNGDPSIEFVSPVFRDSGGDPVIITSTILIGFEPEVAASERAGLRASVSEGAQLQKLEFPQPNDERWQIQSKDGFAVLSRANALALKPGVAYAEPNRIVTGHANFIPNDPNFGSSWGLQNTGQSGGLAGFDMKATSAWDITLGSSSVTVLVLDSGVQQDHPDINQVPGKDFTTDAPSNPNGGPFGTYDNHGTWVAGCISGLINNSLGSTGTAPGVKVASARCYNDTQADLSFSFEFSWLIDALNWGQSIGARVSNNSNTFNDMSGPLETAYANTRAAGMVHFAAAGNGGTASISYPASIASVNAVTAADRFGQRWSNSQYGAGLKFIAPGVEIFTTDRTGAASQPGDYALVSGTSFASAYSAGIAALFVSQSPSFTAADVENQMQRTSTDLGPAGYDTGYGYGMPNASRAVKRSQPANISTRGRVETGDNVMIGGFIITGNQSKQVLIRGIGPSLSQHAVPNVLGDPIIELHDSTPAIVTTNDNWKDSQQSAIQASGLAPQNDLESAILTTLSPGNYTVIVRGTNQSSGVALVEVYDLSPSDGSKLTNISTRGRVQLGDNVMIGGFILGGDGGGSLTVLVRAIGPTLAQYGLQALADPILELHDGNGALIVQNDDWRSDQEQAIINSGLPPSDNHESAILATLAPGNYTAIVRGKNSTIGVALVEVFNLQTN